MALLELDYGSKLGEEIFDNDNYYVDGERLWAARADWFIRFYGYVFQSIPDEVTVNPGPGRALLFVRHSTGEVVLRIGDTFKVLNTGLPPLINLEITGEQAMPVQLPHQAQRLQVFTDASLDDVSMILPLAENSAHLEITIVRKDGSANDCIYNSDESQIINGTTLMRFLSAQYAKVVLISDGVEWFIKV